MITQTPYRVKANTPRVTILLMFTSLLGSILNTNNISAAEFIGIPLFASATLGASYLIDRIFDYTKKRVWVIPVLLFSVAFSGWPIFGYTSLMVIAYGFIRLLKAWRFDYTIYSSRINEELTESVRYVETLLRKSWSPTNVSSVVVDEDEEHKPASAKCIVQQRDTCSDSDDDADDSSKLFLRFYLNGSLLTGARVSLNGSNEYLKTEFTGLEVVS